MSLDAVFWRSSLALCIPFGACGQKLVDLGCTTLLRCTIGRYLRSDHDNVNRKSGAFVHFPNSF